MFKIQSEHREEIDALATQLQDALEKTKQQEFEIKTKDLAVEQGNEQSYLREQELAQQLAQTKNDYELQISQLMQEHAT